jgi:transposase
MGEDSEVFVGIDTSKLRHAVAIAQGGRGGEVRFLGEIEATDAAVTKLVRRLAAKHGKLFFCYEAGPTGYGLYRLIKELGSDCVVVAPSMTPRKPGDRVKTNRRDAVSLARLLRAGELTEVWAPDERHEAMRDLVRARSTAVADLRRKRQQASAFLLRLGRHFPGKKTWGRAHMKWLLGQKLAHREQRVAFEEMMLAISEAQGRVGRLEQAIGAAVPDWSLAEMVTALIGDLGRFSTPRELMAWLGLVPSEASTGDRVRRGSITKAGNSRARRTLVECAHSYRYPARVGLAKQARVAAAPRAVREIAWKAQTRLTARYRALIKRGKLRNVVVTAIARELAGFIWAIHRALTEPRTAA